MAALLQGPNDSELTPEKQAVQWLARVQSGTLNEVETAEFQAWQADELNAAAYIRAIRLWGAIDGVVDEISDTSEVLRERKRILAKVGRRRAYSAGMAACIFVLVPLTLALTLNIQPLLVKIRTAVLVSQPPLEGNFTTTVGERSTVTLRDGSVLTLNTDSAAQVAFNERERKILLTRGQALFEVAKNQSQPFVVYAGDQRIVATGTSFDVRLEKAAVEVTLLEGHLIIDQADSGQKIRSQHAELRAGERLVAEAGAADSVGPANVERVTSWTSGKLIFLDTRLIDAVTEANRYTRRSLVLADPSLSELRVSGVFRVGQPAEFARAVAEIYPLSVNYDLDGKIRISAK